MSTAKARRLWLDARNAAAEGRALIERSVTLRADAFAALPVGVTLEFAFACWRSLLGLRRGSSTAAFD